MKRFALLRILTLNVHRPRRSGAYLAFEDFVAREAPDVLIVTEAHLAAEEARRLAHRRYFVIAESSMLRGATHMRGGAVILVRGGNASEEFGETESPQLDWPVYSRTELVYLNDAEQQDLKITGN